MFDSFWLALLYETFPKIELRLRPYPQFYLTPGEIVGMKDISSHIEKDETVFSEPLKNFELLKNSFKNFRPE